MNKTNPNNKRRKQLSGSVKFQLAIESIKENIPQTELARQYNINPALISRWKQELLNNGYQIFEHKRIDENRKRIEELENIIGKKEIEIQLLKKFLGHYSSA